MRPIQTSPFSWRQDPSVPAFDDSRIILVMDGECALCSAAARRIAALDHADKVRITTVQSDLGRALLSHFKLDPTDPATWLMLTDGRAHGSLDAMVALFPRLHWAFRPMRVLRVLPLGLQDWIYARIARNRYAVFGRGDLCALPDPSLRRKLIP